MPVKKRQLVISTIVLHGTSRVSRFLNEISENGCQTTSGQPCRVIFNECRIEVEKTKEPFLKTLDPEMCPLLSVLRNLRNFAGISNYPDAPCRILEFRQAVHTPSTPSLREQLHSAPNGCSPGTATFVASHVLSTRRRRSSPKTRSPSPRSRI